MDNLGNNNKEAEQSQTVEKESTGAVNKAQEKAEFRAKKYLSGAITWFICAILLIPTFIKTGIWPMAALIPILLILAAGFYLESRKTFVIVDGKNLVMSDYKGFTPGSCSININEIKEMQLDVTEEKNEEIIYSINLIAAGKKIQVPDIDKKGSLVGKILGTNPGIKVIKNS